MTGLTPKLIINKDNFVQNPKHFLYRKTNQRKKERKNQSSQPHAEGSEPKEKNRKINRTLFIPQRSEKKTQRFFLDALQTTGKEEEKKIARLQKSEIRLHGANEKKER